MSSKRISITISDIQNEHLLKRATTQGQCVTGYVYNLVVADIRAGLQDGSLGPPRSNPELSEFILSLASDDGITLDLIDKVCVTLGIPPEKMRYNLGIDDEPEPTEAPLVLGEQLEQNIATEVAS